jgi:hypothetical protein
MSHSTLQPSPHVGRCDPEAKDDDDIGRQLQQQECSPTTTVQWKQQTRRAPTSSPGRASWPGDRGNVVSRGAVVSGELVNGTLLMSPRGHGRSSWRPPPPPTPGDEEEAVDVDLTEPRMEAFTQPAAFR